MSKNTYTIINTTTNQELYTGSSFARAYSFSLDYFLDEQNLGQVVKMVQNVGSDSEQELIRYISARATSGIIHVYDFKKWEKLQTKHEEVLKRREEEAKSLEARKAARKAAKEAMKAAAQKPQEEVKEEPKAEEVQPEVQSEQPIKKAKKMNTKKIATAAE